MLPLLIIPGVILLGGALLAGDSDPPVPSHTLAFGADSPAYKVYQELKAAGVSDQEINRGTSYFESQGEATCVKRIDEKEASDSRIREYEVYETARDVFLENPENPVFKKILQGVFEINLVRDLGTQNYRYQDNRFTGNAVDYLFRAQRYLPFKHPGEVQAYLRDVQEVLCLDPKGVSLRLFFDTVEGSEPAFGSRQSMSKDLSKKYEGQSYLWNFLFQMWEIQDRYPPQP